MITRRLDARIRNDFFHDELDDVRELLEDLELPLLGSGDAARERVQAAVVLLAGGDVEKLMRAADLAEVDWRDVLVAAGLGNGDWAQRLDDALGRTGGPEE